MGGVAGEMDYRAGGGDSQVVDRQDRGPSQVRGHDRRYWRCGTGGGAGGGRSTTPVLRLADHAAPHTVPPRHHHRTTTLAASDSPYSPPRQKLANYISYQ